VGNSCLKTNRYKKTALASPALFFCRHNNSNRQYQSVRADWQVAASKSHWQSENLRYLNACP
jgi:hypothetical protein